MRVLVTGHRGFIGAVLTCVLEHARFDVVGLDCDLYEGSGFGRTREDVPNFDLDLRDVSFADLLSFDAVVHLAALSNDAAGVLDPRLTDEINHRATQHLAMCCKQAGVPRFVFASTCAVYGRRGANWLSESSPAAPQSDYARSKLAGERGVALLADETFCPVILRLATVYGVSPRLRLDTVVNDYVASATTCGRVTMKTFGSAWRPVMHVEDVARVCAAALTAPTSVVHSQVFNVARSDENYRVIDIADAVAEFVPACTRSAPADVFDECSYRVDGSKLQRTFPKLHLRWLLPMGIRQLHSAMVLNGLTPSDWRGDNYRRGPRLQRRLENGKLCGKLGRGAETQFC